MYNDTRSLRFELSMPLLSESLVRLETLIRDARLVEAGDLHAVFIVPVYEDGLTSKQAEDMASRWFSRFVEANRYRFDGPFKAPVEDQLGIVVGPRLTYIEHVLLLIHAYLVWDGEELPGEVVFASRSAGIVLYPYDDRGVDITGTNRPTLSTLYRTRHDWLLDHNRDEMALRYGEET
ncbi:MAG: DUF3885 domain-containing protein [Planctomycetota bacterium]